MSDRQASLSSIDTWLGRVLDTDVKNRRAAVADLKSTVPHTIPRLLSQLREEWSDLDLEPASRFIRAEAIWRISGDFAPLDTQARELLQQTLAIDSVSLQIAEEVLGDLSRDAVPESAPAANAPQESTNTHCDVSELQGGSLVDVLVCGLRCRGSPDEEVFRVLAFLLNCGPATAQQFLRRLIWPRDFPSRPLGEHENHFLLNSLATDKWIWTAFAGILFEYAQRLTYDISFVIPQLSQIARIDEVHPDSYGWQDLEDESHSLRFWSACALWRLTWNSAWVYPALLNWLEANAHRMDVFVTGTVLAEVAISNHQVWPDVRKVTLKMSEEQSSVLLERMLERHPPGWQAVWNWIDDSPALRKLVFTSASCRAECPTLALARARRLIRRQAESTAPLTVPQDELRLAFSLLKELDIQSADLLPDFISLAGRTVGGPIDDFLFRDICYLLAGWMETGDRDAVHLWSVTERVWCYVQGQEVSGPYREGLQRLLEGCLAASWDDWRLHLTHPGRDEQFLRALLQHGIARNSLDAPQFAPPGDCSLLLGSPASAVRELTARRLCARPEYADAAWADVVAALLAAEDDVFNQLMPVFDHLELQAERVVHELLELADGSRDRVSTRARITLAHLVRSQTGMEPILTRLTASRPPSLGKDQADRLLREITMLGTEQGIPDRAGLRNRLKDVLDAEFLEQLFPSDSAAWEAMLGKLWQALLSPDARVAPPSSADFENLAGYRDEPSVLPYLVALYLSLNPEVARGLMLIRIVKEIRFRTSGSLMESKQMFETAFAALPDCEPFIELSALNQPLLVLLSNMLQHSVSWFRWAALVLIRRTGRPTTELLDRVRNCCDDRAVRVAEEARKIVGEQPLSFRKP